MAFVVFSKSLYPLSPSHKVAKMDGKKYISQECVFRIKIKMFQTGFLNSLADLLAKQVLAKG